MCMFLLSPKQSTFDALQTATCMVVNGNRDVQYSLLTEYLYGADIFVGLNSLHYIYFNSYSFCLMISHCVNLMTLRLCMWELNYLEPSSSWIIFGQNIGFGTRRRTGFWQTSVYTIADRHTLVI